MHIHLNYVCLFYTYISRYLYIILGTYLFQEKLGTKHIGSKVVELSNKYMGPFG